MPEAMGEAARVRRIGLLGGTFDPVHSGHLAIAHAAQTQLHLEEIWFVPAGQPWQKTRIPSPAVHRVALLQLAIHDQPTWRVEDIELRSAGPSYAVDTVNALRKAYPNASYTWLLGADQLHNLASWHDWPTLLSLCQFGIAPRPGYFDKAIEPVALLNGSVIASDDLAAVPAPILHWLQANGFDPCKQLNQLRMAPLTCASSAIRASLATGGRVDDCLPPAVLHYLLTHQLY